MQTNINKPDSDKDVLLKMVDIEKSFPGVKALDHAQLTVRRGTVHALMGENGAGKSTRKISDCFKISSVYKRKENV